MTKSDAKIKVEFHEGKGPSKEMGFTTPEKYDVTNFGQDIVLKEAKIDIYLGSIDETHSKIEKGELTSETQNITKQQGSNIETIKNNNLTAFDLAVGIFGHEIGHTNNTNVKSRLKEEKTKTNSGGYDSEFNPQRIEGRILDELAKTKK